MAPQGNFPLLDGGLQAGLDSVIQTAYMDGITVQSTMARSSAQYIAAAASLGLITTVNADGTYGRIWRPTRDGYLWVTSMHGSEM